MTYLTSIRNGLAAATVEAISRDAGFLVNAVQPDAVRLAPPLVLSLDEADAFLVALPPIVEAAS